jgi:hypothetical protein
MQVRSCRWRNPQESAETLLHQSLVVLTRMQLGYPMDDDSQTSVLRKLAQRLGTARVGSSLCWALRGAVRALGASPTSNVKEAADLLKLLSAAIKHDATFSLSILCAISIAHRVLDALGIEARAERTLLSLLDLAADAPQKQEHKQRRRRHKNGVHPRLLSVSRDRAPSSQVAVHTVPATHETSLRAAALFQSGITPASTVLPTAPPFSPRTYEYHPSRTCSHTAHSLVC